MVNSALAVSIAPTPVVECDRLFLGESNLRRITTDQQLIQETSISITGYLQNGFPTTNQGLQELTEVLGMRKLYLDPDPNITASDRASLVFPKATDKFLTNLTSKLEAESFTEKDLDKLKLLNLHIQSKDQIAIDYIMIDFDRKSIGQLNSVINGHQHFQKLWTPEPSQLSIDDQFQLVNARGVLTKQFQESGLSTDVVNFRLSEIFTVANELTSLGIKVPQVIGFLVNDGRNTVHSNFSFEERYQFLSGVAKLCQQPIPPLGLAPYVTHIFNSKQDMSGNMQEAIVAASLLKSGWNIRAISQPVYSPRTELDIIASRGGENYVIEVKTSTQTLMHKNDQRDHDNQITNLLTHCDIRRAHLAIYCLDQPRVHISGVIKAVTNALQNPEDAYKVLVLSFEGSVFNLEGQKVA